MLRQHPNIAPFQGMGVWVDLYDDWAWKHPAAAVADMAAHGVRTLYLETSNFNRPFPFADKQGVAAFVDAAHADGVQIVAWYLPNFVDVGQDADRSKAAIRFRTDAGNAFDGFALDIEAPDVADTKVRTARLLDLSGRIRSFAGDDYPLGGIIPSPRGIVVHKDYWPGFPYAELAAVYDVLMPMSYFTWHHPTGDSTHLYLTQNIRIIRREVGSDQVPIHVIGGIAQDASQAQAQAFVDVLRERGVIGGSYYTYTGVDDAEWGVLQQIWTNQVETPAMPVLPGERPSSATSPAPTRRTRPASSTRWAGSRGIARSPTTRSTRRRARSRSTSTGSPSPRSPPAPTATGPARSSC